jgi:23S rRNA pseudouridine1911/1915/1917 synthase
MSRSKVKACLTDGRVHVNGTAITQHNHPITPQDQISLAPAGKPPQVEESVLGEMQIVHEDRAIILVDKPAGLLSVATEGEKFDTAYARLRADRELRQRPAPHIVHRLDRETSGLLLFATTYDGKHAIQEKWEEVEKKYIAVVCGALPRDEGIITTYLRELPNLRVTVCSAEAEGGEWAQTRYRVLGKTNALSTVEVELVTGRKHQIRVHLAHLGCPVIGDTVYEAPLNPAGRLGLHAVKLSLTHPETQKRMHFESQLPAALARHTKGAS